MHVEVDRTLKDRAKSFIVRAAVGQSHDHAGLFPEMTCRSISASSISTNTQFAKVIELALNRLLAAPRAQLRQRPPFLRRGFGSLYIRRRTLRCRTPISRNIRRSRSPRLDLPQKSSSAISASRAVFAMADRQYPRRACTDAAGVRRRLPRALLAYDSGALSNFGADLLECRALREFCSRSIVHSCLIAPAANGWMRRR